MAARAGLALLILGPFGGGVLAGCSAWSHRQDLAAQIAAARTAADYDAIAQALTAEADRYAADAQYHRVLAARYEESGRALWERHHIRSDLRIAEHCQSAAENLEHAAGELREMAREQERRARALEGKKSD